MRTKGTVRDSQVCHSVLGLSRLYMNCGAMDNRPRYLFNIWQLDMLIPPFETNFYIYLTTPGLNSIM